MSRVSGSPQTAQAQLKNKTFTLASLAAASALGSGLSGWICGGSFPLGGLAASLALLGLPPFAARRALPVLLVGLFGRLVRLVAVEAELGDDALLGERLRLGGCKAIGEKARTVQMFASREAQRPKRRRVRQWNQRERVGYAYVKCIGVSKVILGVGSCLGEYVY